MVMTDDKMQEAAKKFNFNDIEDMLSAVGFGGITAAQICTKLTEKMRKEDEEAIRYELTKEVKEVKAAPQCRKTRPTHGVRLKVLIICWFALHDAVILCQGMRLSAILHEDEEFLSIVWIVRNLNSSTDGEEAARVIEVEWEESVEANYNVDIEITGMIAEDY